MPIAYPYKFTDWYGYDKDCSSVTAFTSAIAETGLSCTQTLNQTYYHDGSGTYPVASPLALAVEPPEVVQPPALRPEKANPQI